MTQPLQKQNQHYVPESYLKAWRDVRPGLRSHEAAKVWVFKKDSIDGKAEFPRSLFQEKDFYTVFRDGEVRDLGIEDSLELVESRFGSARQKLTNGVWPTEAEMGAVLLFIATMKARTRAFHDFQSGQWQHVERRLTEIKEDLEANRTNIQARITVLGRSENDGRPSFNRTGIGEIAELATRPVQHLLGRMVAATLPILSRMSVAVLYTLDEVVPIITTDDPCVWVDPEVSWKPAGLSSRSVEVTLPLSPRTCLLLSHGPEVAGFYEMSHQQTHALNRQHIAHCHRFFVSNSPVAHSEWLAH